MSEQKSKQLYTSLLIKKYNNVENFILSIKNEESTFWECSKDVAKETLLFNRKWYWLGDRVDDYANIINRDIILKLEKWKQRGSFATVHSHNSLEDVIQWLFERYISMLKNLFDSRYKLSIQATFIRKLMSKY
ncbi:MAG: hypothetical protein Q9M91_07225 [Candidatus Dojkabacteria bacterium]|nr:hypothetical protein [Candidatus Dojkabacteria bacterium]